MAFMSNLNPLSGGALVLLVLATIVSIVSLSTNSWESASPSGGKTNSLAYSKKGCTPV